MPYRIFYFRGPLLESTAEAVTEDLVEAAKLASSSHPDLTAEIWHHDRKVAVCLPSWEHRTHSPSRGLRHRIPHPKIPIS